MSSSDDEARAEDAKERVKSGNSKDSVKEEKVGLKEEVKSPERKLPQRKKSSILDMLTRGGSQSEAREEKEGKKGPELVVLDEEGDEMLV
jgi:SWI/SNF-related matrix-associated actin-dependent regulator 1 of chromatin subfamily A